MRPHMTAKHGDYMCVNHNLTTHSDRPNWCTLSSIRMWMWHWTVYPGDYGWPFHRILALYLTLKPFSWLYAWVIPDCQVFSFCGRVWCTRRHLCTLSSRLVTIDLLLLDSSYRTLHYAHSSPHLHWIDIWSVEMHYSNQLCPDPLSPPSTLRWRHGLCRHGILIFKAIFSAQGYTRHETHALRGLTTWLTKGPLSDTNKINLVGPTRRFLDRYYSLLFQWFKLTWSQGVPYLKFFKLNLVEDMLQIIGFRARI